MRTSDIIAIINALTPLVKELGVIVSAAASIFAAYLIFKTGKKVEVVAQKTDLNHEIALANREALSSVSDLATKIALQTDGMQRALQDGAFREGRAQGVEETKIGGAEAIMRDNAAGKDSGELVFRRRATDRVEDAATASAVVVQKVEGV